MADRMTMIEYVAIALRAKLPVNMPVARELAKVALLAAAEAELSDDVGVTGIEVSLLGHPRIDDAAYVLSIFRAICHAAAEESQP